MKPAPHPATTVAEDRGPALLAHARGAIHEALGGPALGRPVQDWFFEPAACFVTLTQGGELRGCIGSLVAHRPLHEDLRANALAAAFTDPRFPPLSRFDLDAVRVEVSLLSPLESLEFSSEAELLAQLRPGVDGVVLSYRHLRGTFLPQVWEELPDPRDFLAHLKRKAGLPAVFWPEGMEAQRYTVSKWREAP